MSSFLPNVIVAQTLKDVPTAKIRASNDLDKKVQRRIAVRRRNELMKRQAGISKKKLTGLVGRQTEVLLEGRSDESDLLLQGRMETQAPDIDGHVLINDVGEAEAIPGSFYKVEITDSLEYDVIGRILEA